MSNMVFMQHFKVDHIVVESGMFFKYMRLLTI